MIPFITAYLIISSLLTCISYYLVNYYEGGDETGKEIRKLSDAINNDDIAPRFWFLFFATSPLLALYSLCMPSGR